MNKEPLVMLIGHRKRSGKDTFGNMLEEKLLDKGITVKKYSFAYSLKRVVANNLGISIPLLDKLKDNPPKKYHWVIQQLRYAFGKDTRFSFDPRRVRDELIKTATELQDIFGITIFRDQVINKIKQHKDIDVVIITDFRQPDREYIPDSLTININRDKANILTSQATETKNDNYPYDLVINNNGDLYFSAYTSLYLVGKDTFYKDDNVSLSDKAERLAKNIHAYIKNDMDRDTLLN